MADMAVDMNVPRFALMGHADVTGTSPTLHAVKATAPASAAAWKSHEFFRASTRPVCSHRLPRRRAAARVWRRRRWGTRSSAYRDAGVQFLCAEADALADGDDDAIMGGVGTDAPAGVQFLCAEGRKTAEHDTALRLARAGVRAHQPPPGDAHDRGAHRPNWRAGTMGTACAVRALLPAVRRRRRRAAYGAGLCAAERRLAAAQRAADARSRLDSSGLSPALRRGNLLAPSECPGERRGRSRASTPTRPHGVRARGGGVRPRAPPARASVELRRRRTARRTRQDAGADLAARSVTTAPPERSSPAATTATSARVRRGGCDA